MSATSHAQKNKALTPGDLISHVDVILTKLPVNLWNDMCTSRANALNLITAVGIAQSPLSEEDVKTLVADFIPPNVATKFFKTKEEMELFVEVGTASPATMPAATSIGGPPIPTVKSFSRKPSATLTHPGVIHTMMKQVKKKTSPNLSIMAIQCAIYRILNEVDEDLYPFVAELAKDVTACCTNNQTNDVQ